MAHNHHGTIDRADRGRVDRGRVDRDRADRGRAGESFFPVARSVGSVLIQIYISITKELIFLEIFNQNVVK